MERSIRKNKIVFFQGTFDILNGNHVKCFEFASKFGDVIVGLNTDSLIESYKKRKPVMSYGERKLLIESLKFVNKVVPCNHFSPMEQLKRYEPQVYVCGSEWIEAHAEEFKYVRSYGGKIEVTPHHKKYLHSSEIRKKIKNDKSL